MLEISGGQDFDECVFLLDADEVADFLSIFEKDQRWDGTHAELRGQCGAFINVHFGNDYFVADFGSDFLENWGLHFARTAPRSPEINQHGSRSNCVCEIGGAKFFY